MSANPIEPNQNLWIDESLRKLFARNDIACLDDLFLIEGTKLEKPTLPSWRERVAIDLVDEDGQPHRFYVKRFNRKGKRNPLASMIRGGEVHSPARIERDWIVRLKESGISVPNVVAFGEEITEQGRDRSALVLAEVPGESLERWVLRQTHAAPRKLIEAVADLASAFHESGHIHRDFYLSHIFLNERDALRPQLALIDLQRVMYRPLRLERWRNRDLAQLNFSVPDHVAGVRERVRFLRRYFGVRNLRSVKYRRVMKAVVGKSAQIAAHERRRQARILKAGVR